jgi:hypothetical protein
MAGDLAAQLESIASGDYRPTTFLERGVAVPFTTPMLLGARLRPSNRKGMELVIANISGGRGFYIVSWSALAEICAPSLHDERLFALLTARAALSPGEIRQVARQVAQEGWGGRNAIRAAHQAESEAPLDRMRLNLRLLHRLVRQTESPIEATPPIAQDTPEGQQHRAKRAVLRAAETLSRRPEEVIQSLEGIAGAFQDVGVPEEPMLPRLRRMLAAVERMSRDFAEWVALTPAARDLQVSAVIAEGCGLTLRCGTAMLEQVEAGMADMIGLLRRWQADPDALVTEATRPDWLLDGWPLILGLWQDTDPADRLRAAWEAAMLLPVLPRETAAWCGVQADWEQPQRLRRLVRAHRDWRHGRMVDLTARNERLLASTL